MGGEAIQVLLVEDDVDHAELISRAFEDRTGQMNLTIAGSLREARALLTESDPEVVIVDSLLPDGRGLELLPSVRPESPCAVVMMASQRDQNMKAEAHAAGAHYVVKTEELLFSFPDFVDRVLENRKAKSE